MSRDEALKLLRAHKATLVERFGVTTLALFGSTAVTRQRTAATLTFWCVSTDRQRQSGTLACSSTSKTCWAIRWTW